MTGSTPPVPRRYADAVLIGVGGMAEVYRATDAELGRPVAVKVLSAALATDDDHRRRFAREAQAAARIRSPHVAAIYDVGEWQGRPYIVMELIAGGTLADRMREGPVTDDEALGWVAQAAAAIDAAHADGVVHRDVTPSNLMLTPDGAVRVVDFGIARVLEGDASATITRTGMAVGTAGYLSPEQAQGERGSTASDVYALAVVAYELLTGGRPFGGRSAPAEMAARLRDAPPPPSGRRPGLPPAIDPVFARALAIPPERRQESAAAFSGELQAAMARGGTATAPVVPEVRADPRRVGVLAGVAAIVLVGAAVAAAAAGVFGSGDGGGSDPAAAQAPATTEQVRTVTQPGPATTLVRTTTAPAAPAAPAPGSSDGDDDDDESAAPANAPSLDRAQRMTNDAWDAITEGRPERAVRLMERAVPVLAGSGDEYEGYAYYNLGRGLLDLGRCQEAIPHLEASLAQPGSEAQLSERAEMLDRARACAA
jgi:eukaryotic-like serine/threonine-protein kinase